ncbi:TolC family protein [Halomonas sp. SpR8]|uniref:TolC family protein n=1 Tax=Halomonas sp. SpR8 TaxID=3050463 RepID=UPI0027E4ED3B|nr:TolC family protein [Halomonas sp. SpR8]MDQ7729492.1 TolC family protein [Halomonas sp. SpR8]
MAESISPSRAAGRLLLGGLFMAALPACAWSADFSVALRPDVLPSMPLDQPDNATNSLPSLPRMFDRALEYNAALASQRLQAEARGLEVPLAWSRLQPQVDLSFQRGYSGSDNIYTGGDISSCVNNPETGELIGGEEFERRCQGESTDTIGQISLSQPLFSIERFRQVEKANRQSDTAQLQLAVSERNLALQTAEAWLNAFYLSRQVDLLDSKRHSLDLQVVQAQRAYDLGIGDRIDLLAAHSEFDRTLADIAAARNDYDNALSTLERLTGTFPDFNSFTLLELPEDDFDSPPPLSTLEDAIVNNAEVLLAVAQRDVARADIEVRRAGYYPEVSLNLSYSDRHSNDPYRDSEDKRVVLQASMNLYAGGRTRNSVAQGILVQNAAMADINNARRLALEQLRQYHRSIRGDITRLQALAQSIRSGELYLEAADKGAALGLRDLVDVLNARADLYSQRIQYVDAFRRLLMNRLNMRAAIGELGTDDLVGIMHQVNAIIAPSHLTKYDLSSSSS